jgi:hypothetical protein
MESALVASSMMSGFDLTVPQEQATPNIPHYSIHLGDIYYVGLSTEVQHCCLGVKPHGQNEVFDDPLDKMVVLQYQEIMNCIVVVLVIRIIFYLT